jgi:glycosyltransferase involved in cell wall biosynthesis
MLPLAIVIPAYKARFLTATLRSIAAQTCQRFVVYIGDDASPEDLHSLCRPWADHMDLRYHRFEQNLGGFDLVGQWQRCIDLSTEPWVWLFSDDDLMASGCVERLLQAVEEEGQHQPLFHFNVEKIDAQGQLLLVEPEFPPMLSSRAFAIARLRFQLSSYAPDYAFDRAHFLNHGGFQAFPRAWCSDDATWIKLSAGHGIRTLSDAKVGWRLSGANISSQHTEDAEQKIQALAAFATWLDGHLASHPPEAGEPEDGEVLRWVRGWFFKQIEIMRHSFGAWPALRLLWQISAVRGMGLRGTLAGIWWGNVRQRSRQAAAAHGQ